MFLFITTFLSVFFFFLTLLLLFSSVGGGGGGDEGKSGRKEKLQLWRMDNIEELDETLTKFQNYCIVQKKKNLN